MANIPDSIRNSSLNLKAINTSFRDASRTTSSVNNSVNNISKVISNNSRNKSVLYAKNNIIDSRRREASKRREIEDENESRKVSMIPKAGLGYANRLQGGPLTRLFGFLGFVTAGWIINNLPTWTFMGKEFVSRIYKVSSSLYNMIDDIQLISRTFGDLLKNSFDAIIRLDFDEFSEGKVLQSFDSMTTVISDLGKSISEAFEVFRTPLTQSLDTGEQAPELGSERSGTMFPGVSQEYGSYSGSETTSSGVLNPQAAYAYIRQLGVSHIHALGILANIQGESDFRIAADETGRGDAGIGLFQYTEPSRKRRFLRAVPNYKTNWKGQIKYAILNDENSPLYLRKQFSSPEEAADDFMRNWENPDSAVYKNRRKVHNNFIRNFKTPTTSNNYDIPSRQQVQPVPSGPIKPLIGDRLGVGRNHGGVDLIVDYGTPIRAISDGTIVDSDYERGWGNFLVMKDNLGIYHLYGHMQSGYKTKGQVKKGEVIGKVGMTGRTTGPHLHWEAGTNWNKSRLENPFDALNVYSRYAPFNTRPDTNKPIKSQVSSPKILKPSVAQVSSLPKLQQPSSTITPEREGSNIILMDMTQSQQPVVTSQSSYSSMQPVTIDEFKMLNNFIKNKLLLDLAYL